MFTKAYIISNIAYVLGYVVGFSESGYFIPEQRKEFPYYVSISSNSISQFECLF